ncbi:tellurium resistance protein TerZ [Novosphingobium barchaimii LL02]|uniref:Tellurium resistance protein TerZ n=1 Tax=Novosphingobium barchaimii LL02 TaxID=1114963 RepID=A0A0J7XWX9_9SPHN|nr:TerD family protein [Novosphingobium barchaimii]KMS56221.1 tellurium resistance protein TerZ [Novosphingobium barchaimii LL02]
MVSLQKGQSVRLEKSGGGSLTRVSMGLGWDVRKAKGLFAKLTGGGGGEVDLDASCLLFDAQRNLLDQVWFRQLASHDGSIVHSGDNRTGAGDGDDETINVDLTRLPANVQTLLFTVNSFLGDSFDRIDNAYCRVVDSTNSKELARYDLTGSGTHTGQIMAKVVRVGEGWEMKALGERTTGRTFQDMMSQIIGAL